MLEEGRLRLWRLREPEDEVRFRSRESFAKIQTDYEEERPEGKGLAHAGILQSYADAIRKGTPLLSPGEDGLKELAISNAAYLSAWQGGIPVALPFDEALFDRLLRERAEGSAYVSRSRERGDIDGRYSDRWQVRW